MSDEEEVDGPSWDLVMPFVMVASKGGPFDDDSFVAGYRCGGIDALLSQPETVLYDTQARADDLPQLDLIAMRRNFRIDSRPLDDEWFAVRFERQ